MRWYLLGMGFGTAILFGLSDYETESIWQLFNAENLPAMVIFTLMFFGLFSLIYGLIGRFRD